MKLPLSNRTGCGLLMAADELTGYFQLQGFVRMVFVVVLEPETKCKHRCSGWRPDSSRTAIQEFFSLPFVQPESICTGFQVTHQKNDREGHQILSVHMFEVPHCATLNQCALWEVVRCAG